MGFVKVTFFILYLHLFRPLRGFKVAIWIGGIFTALFYLATIIAAFVLSTPRPGESWPVHFQGPSQGRLVGLVLVTPVMGILIDLYILILPLMVVNGLQIQRKRKIGVSLMFLTGILLVFFSMLHLQSFRADHNPQRCCSLYIELGLPRFGHTRLP